MKLQRTTLGLVLIAILLGGFVYFYEFRLKSQQEAVKKKQQQLFSFKEEDVKNLKITTPKESITLERSPESAKTKTKWQMKSPDNVPANDGTVAYLLNLLETEKSNRTLSAKPPQVSEFGLKQPQATIDVTLNNQKNHKLVLGKQSFDNRYIYARNQFATKPDENVEVVLVSKKFEDAINRSLSEWKAVDNNQTTTTPTPTVTPTIPTTGATPAIPNIKPIPIDPKLQTPNPNNSNNSTTQTPTSTPNNSNNSTTQTPTPTPNNSNNSTTQTPTSTPKTTPNNSTPKPKPTPTPTLNPPSAPTKD